MHALPNRHCIAAFFALAAGASGECLADDFRLELSLTARALSEGLSDPSLNATTLLTDVQTGGVITTTPGQTYVIEVRYRIADLVADTTGSIGLNATQVLLRASTPSGIVSRFTLTNFLESKSNDVGDPIVTPVLNPDNSGDGFGSTGLVYPLRGGLTSDLGNANGLPDPSTNPLIFTTVPLCLSQPSQKSFTGTNPTSSNTNSNANTWAIYDFLYTTGSANVTWTASALSDPETGTRFGFFRRQGSTNDPVAQNSSLANDATITFQVTACAADVNGSGTVTVQDIFDFLGAWFKTPKCLPPLPPACNGINADFNNSGSVTVQDIFDFLTAWFAGCTTAPALAVSPTTGGLGTVLTMTVSPASAPYVFGSATTASWTGQYVATGGGSSGTFTITFPTTDVGEISASQAQVVLGTGSATMPAGIEAMGSGTFQGTLSVVFAAGATLTTPLILTPASSTQVWNTISYPDGAGGLTSPVRGPTVATCTIWATSLLPATPPLTASQFTGASDLHYTVSLLTNENATSTAAAPSQITVDLIALESNDSEIARTPVTFFRDDADGDAAHITYRSALTMPIVLVDTPVTAPSGFVVLMTTATGRVIIGQHR